MTKQKQSYGGAMWKDVLKISQNSQEKEEHLGLAASGKTNDIA